MAKLERSRGDAVDQWRLQTGRHEVWMLALDPLCCCFYSAPKCLGCWRKTLSPPSGNLQSSWKIQVQDPVRSQDPLEKEMATHSSILAWRIPWTKEPGRLQSMVLYYVIIFKPNIQNKHLPTLLWVPQTISVLIETYAWGSVCEQDSSFPSHTI